MELSFETLNRAASENHSFAYIIPDDEIEFYERNLIDKNLDYDMIKGVLGAAFLNNL